MKNVLIATNFDCGKYVLIDANLIKKNLSRSTFAFEKLLKYILQIRSQSSFFFHLELFTINIFVFSLFLVFFFFLLCYCTGHCCCRHIAGSMALYSLARPWRTSDTQQRPPTGQRYGQRI